MIRFACPQCQVEYTVPDATAGRKTNCRKCGQRLQVPALPNKTVLAPLLQHKPDVNRPPTVPPSPPCAIPVLGAGDVVGHPVLAGSVPSLNERGGTIRAGLVPASRPVPAVQLSRVLSLAGALVLTLGIFCPVLQVPLIGGISLFNLYKGTSEYKRPDKGELLEGDDSNNRQELVGLALLFMIVAIGAAVDSAFDRPHHIPFVPREKLAAGAAMISVALAAIFVSDRMSKVPAVAAPLVHVGWGWGVLAVGILLLSAGSRFAQESEQSGKAK